MYKLIDGTTIYTSAETDDKIAEAVVQTDVTTEKNRAEAAEALLQSNIDKEKARATKEELLLKQDVLFEFDRASKEEKNLQDQIDAITPGPGPGPDPDPYVLPAATESALGGIQAPVKSEDQIVPVGIGPDNKLYVAPSSETYTLPAATESTLGGVQAPVKTEDQTVPVGIGPDNKLYVAPSGGSSGPSLPGCTYYVDSQESLDIWINNTPGNDYSCVAIKAGTYSVTKTIDLNNTKTLCVYGLGDVTIVGNNSLPVFLGTQGKNRLQEIIINIYVSSANCGFREICNLFNCKATDCAISYGYCNNLASCHSYALEPYVETHKHTAFMHCHNVSNCYSYIYYDPRYGFSAYTDCSNMHDNIIEIENFTTPEGMLENTRIVDFCKSVRYTKILGISDEVAQAHAYRNSYASPTEIETYKCANTLEGGFNYVSLS